MMGVYPKRDNVRCKEFFAKISSDVVIIEPGSSFFIPKHIMNRRFPFCRFVSVILWGFSTVLSNLLYVCIHR